jgi:filamentous hemagglutinin
VSDTLNGLSPIFDKDKVQAGFDIVTTAQQQVGAFIAKRAADADKIKESLEAEVAKGKDADPVELRRLNAQYADAAKWLPGGSGRQALTVLLAAAAGNVAGGVGDFVQSAALAYLQAEGAQLVKALADSLPEGAERETVRAAMHAVLACGTSAGQGGSCVSGAGGAGLSSLLGYLLDPPQDAASTEASANLLNGLAAAVVAGLGGDVVTAATAAKIEAENNGFYRHPSYVAESTHQQRAALEEAVHTGQMSRQEYEANIKTLDAASAKIDALMTIYRVNSASGLSAVLAQMKPADLAMFGQAVADMLVVPGMVSSAYELLTGKTAATQEEANYFFAVLGVVPGGKVVKGVEKLGEVARVVSDLASVSAAERIAANARKGKTFEEAVYAYLKETKNKESFSVMSKGKLTTVIPDGVLDGGRILEIKDAAYLSNSSQFRAYAKMVEEGGVVARGADKGVFKEFSGIDLVVSPSTKISEPLEQLIRESGGSIMQFDPLSKEFRPWVRQ